jgi:1-phosphofructokinase family hexose kinase
MKIVTLTLSPALDIEYRLEKIRAAGMNRTSSHRIAAGGKGINVSRSILNCAAADREREKFPFELRTVAPVGGETGELLRRILEKEGISLTAVKIEENTRVNVSLIPDSGASLEINAPGTPVGGALAEIEKAVLDGIGAGDWVVIAGSCPQDVPKSYPSELIAKIKEKGASAALDCDGPALKIAVNAPVKPDLIKPNNEELAELTGCSPFDPGELAASAESLGIPTVITTRAGEDPLLTDERGTVFISAVKRKVVRLKGAGDTFLGAFLYARCVRGGPPECAMEVAADTAGRYVAGE